MSIKYGFFNSVNGDRLYNAEDIGNYFVKLISDGVFPSPENNLQVAPSSGMTVSVAPGWGFIACHWLNSDAFRSLTLNGSNPSLNRIDRIVLRLDRANRRMEIGILNGTPAGTPVAPSLTRTSNGIYELSLAQIYVAAGTTAITETDITDERENSLVCGYVTSLLGGIRIVVKTRAEYDAMITHDPNTLYLVKNDGNFTLFFGDLPQQGSGTTPTYALLNTISPPPAVIGHATIEEE